MDIYEILKGAAGIIGQGCKVIMLLIVFVLLAYILKNLVKGLWEADKEE